MIDNELNQAFNLVSQHNNFKIKEGEAKLAQLRKDCNYPLNLLFYINNNQSLELQLRAAIELKLWCESYQNLEEFQRKFYEPVIQSVKEKIVVAYLVFQGKVSETLRPGIVRLADAEFPYKWSPLMLGLIQYANQNTDSIHSVLLLIQDITRKYSILTRSDPLYEEIILVCDQTHDFLLDLTVKIIQSQTMDQATLAILETLMNIFYHLNYQDLHPKFEDNANTWMSILKQIMGFSNQNETVFKCKGAALESILLYANKYKEDVEEAIKGFSSEIWDLCSNATDDPEYDSIVFNCLKYFKSIILWQEMKQFFIDNLSQLIEKLIMPNLKINKNILEMFNDEPETFFDYYFKNNDIQTRRSASLDLMRVICRHFPNFESYVIQKIQDFTTNMTNSSIQEKCNLLNFIIDSATKSFRDVDGCTDTYINSGVIVQCFEHIVYADLGQIYSWILQNQNKVIEDAINHTLLITCMRFCYFFRVYIPSNSYEVIIKFASAITTNHKSIKTMIFMVINAFITVRQGDFNQFKNLKPYFNAQNAHEITKDVLQTIYKNDQSETELNQNLTKMLYTLARTLAEGSVQYYEYFDALIPQMLLKTQKYDFKSVLFLFEAIGVIAFWVSKGGHQQEKDKLETHIINYFYVAIKRNSDLLNFCFQILAIFLHFENKKADKHTTIYNSLLDISNWVEENISIMSSYIQYISAYLNRSSGNLISDKAKFEEILTRLIFLEHYDLFFRFLDSILKISNIDQFYESGYFKISMLGSEAVMQKSIFGKKIGVLFIFKLMNQYDLNKVVQYMNNVVPNLFQNIITNSDDIIRTMQARKDRKMMYGAICKIISMGQIFDDCRILTPEIQGGLLGLLVENSTNKHQMSYFRDGINMQNQSQSKESTYQKLQIFNMMDSKEKEFEMDEDEELCKTYVLCENSHRPSLHVINQKNHDRFKRLKEKYSQTLGNVFQGNHGGNRIF